MDLLDTLGAYPLTAEPRGATFGSRAGLATARAIRSAAPLNVRSEGVIPGAG